MSTKSSYDLFQNSWILAPELAMGEIMIRLDDDDILLNDSLKY
jgi:hypothetical protein